MDSSFFRFLDNFDDAKNLRNRKLSAFDYDMQIHLKPGETYTSISNNVNGISFSNNYKCYIVSCDGTILADITNNVVVVDFIDDKTALKQIKFEVFGVTNDYYTDLVSFRLDQNIVNGKKYWTNPFIISNYDVDETSRFRFKNYINLDGTNYRVANIFQSIRLKCVKQKTIFSSTGQSYTTFQGLKYSSRTIKTKGYEFLFEMLNDFVYNRLQYLLTHDVIYIDNVRVTDKQTFESSDKLGESNIAQSKFKVSVDESDIDVERYQIHSNDYDPFDYNTIDYKTR